MSLPPPIIPAKRRVRRKRRQASTTTPPGGPVLMAAGFDTVAYTVTLAFDRAVDVAGLVGEAIVVDDATLDMATFAAIGEVTVLSPTTVRVGLVETGPSTGEGQTLTAGPASGIVAADGGAAWAGVSGLALPFP